MASVSNDVKSSQSKFVPLQQESRSCDIDDTKSRIGDEYVLVKKSRIGSDSKQCTDPLFIKKGSVLSSSGDEKLNSNIPPLIRVGPDIQSAKTLSKARGLLRGTKGLGRAIPITLYTTTSASLAANTAVALSFPLEPSASAEYSALSGLFDEIKVLSVDIDVAVANIKAGTVTPAGAGVFVGCGYDSTYDTNPTSIAEVLESTQHALGFCPVLSSDTGYASSLHPSKPIHFHIDIPKNVVLNTTAVTGGLGINNNFPGSWMAVGDTSDSVGYWRLYAPAAGGATALSYNAVIALHCVYRERT